MRGRQQGVEQLQPLVVPWAQALAWVDDGTVEDAKTLAGLLLWERWRHARKS